MTQLYAGSLARYKFLVDTLDSRLSPHLILDGYWESWITIAIARAVEEGMHCVDVGANLGYYTVLLADAVGPTGRVLAIEPNPRPASLMRKTLILNGLDRIAEVKECALGDDRASKARLVIPRMHPSGASLLHEPEVGDEVIDVSLSTLDELTEDWPRVDFVKIDAEGAEEGIWRGASDVIARNPELRIALEINVGRYDDSAVDRPTPEAAQIPLMRLGAAAQMRMAVPSAANG